MLTTVGFRRSAMSANDASDGGRDLVGAAGTGRGRTVVADSALAGLMVPATTSPTRKATVAERPIVVIRKRRVMELLL
jgi:hypothetical protein